MSRPRLVSILIPAFNAERWLAAAIQSALAQTWPAKEIIVVDDGSADQSLAVARRFSNEGVTVVTQTNQGAAAARNRAYAVSGGEYIQWLDADDLLAPDKIERQLAALSELADPRALASAAWGHFYRRPQAAKFSRTNLWNDLPPIEWLLCNLGDGAFMQTAAWLVSRELSEAAGAWNTTLLGDDDGEYFSRVVAASSTVRFVKSSQMFYRQTTSNRLSKVGLSNRQLEAHFRSMKLQIGNIRKLEDSERTRGACLKFIQRYMRYFYPERLDIVRELEATASELGGRIHRPQLPWKYAGIQKLFGWTVAKKTQLLWNQCKSSVLDAWDDALLRLNL